MRKPTLFEAAADLARIEFGGVPQGTFLESAVLQLTVGDYSGALATASFGLQQSTSPEQVWKGRCVEVEAALRAGKPELAIAAARWLQSIELINAFTNARVAQVAFHQGVVDRALDVLHDTLNKYGDTALIYHDIGSIFYTRGDYNQSRSHLTRAIELEPLYASAYRARGNSYTAAEDSCLAIHDYRTALSLYHCQTLLDEVRWSCALREVKNFLNNGEWLPFKDEATDEFSYYCSLADTVSERKEHDVARLLHQKAFEVRAHEDQPQSSAGIEAMLDDDGEYWDHQQRASAVDSGFDRWMDEVLSLARQWGFTPQEVFSCVTPDYFPNCFRKRMDAQNALFPALVDGGLMNPDGSI